jgi:hypothetical protein
MARIWPSAMDWLQRLADYSRAKAEHDRAERLLAESLTRYDTARRAQEEPLDPLVMGVDLARQRTVRNVRRLNEATFRLTRGRPLDEVLWSLPDEI